MVSGAERLMSGIHAAARCPSRPTLQPKPSGPSTTAAAADDAKRAALREALAQKMKQNIMGAN